MCSDFKLLDTVALQNRLSTNFALVGSQDNQYCIVVEDGLYVLKLCGLMDNILPATSFKKLFTKISNFAVSSHLGIDIHSFIYELPQFELYEAVLRLDISETLNASTPTKQQPVQAKWSPLGLISNGHCALASLSNTGVLSVFVRTFNEVELEEFIIVANISKLCIDHFKLLWGNIENCSPSIKLEELKRRASEVTVTAFTWSNLQLYEDKKFCLLIAGHLNGGITVWKFDVREANNITESGVNFVGYYKTELKRITALHWQPSGKNGLLVVGDLGGNVRAIPVTDIDLRSVSFGNELVIWYEADDIKVDFFNIFVYDNMIYLLIVKGSCLLVCLINNLGEIVDIHNFHAGNYQITGVEHFEENIFLILTYTGVLKEIKLTCDNNRIRIDWRPLYIDFKWSLYHTHGLIVSPNKVFIGVLVNMSKITDIKRRKDPVRMLVFMNMGKDPLAVLMKNPTDSLTTYWDCLEILRLDGLIEKKLPCDGIPAGLDYDRLSLIQLKTCLWLARSSEVMYDKMYTIEDYNILRYDEFKCIVKLKLAVKHMHHLLELLADGTVLSEFHMQSLDILNMYLKETIIDDAIPHLGLGKNTIDELYDVVSAANELTYPSLPSCMWCKESIIGLTCIPAHVDTRCNMSYMPILGLPYYKCQFCESIVHSKLNEVYNVVLCPYCDVPLAMVSSLINSDGALKDPNTVHEEKSADMDVSCCNNDCLKETIDEIEDHAFTSNAEKGEHVDLLWISSSDEDDADDNRTETSVVDPPLPAEHTASSRKVEGKISKKGNQKEQQVKT